MIVVFSDLDGTLLDHDSYSFEAAKPALALLKNRKIPLVLASSKTEAEMRPIAEAMGLQGPMIVENGAGIADTSVNTPSEQGNHVHAALTKAVRQLPKHLQGCFEGFSDWDLTRVVAETGLSAEAAARAKTRRFSEPGRFSGTEAQKAEFVRLLDASGFSAVQGGRFFTLMPKTSKAARMAEVAASLAASSGESVRTVALGDGMNDLDMLQAADCGIIIANPSHAPLPVTKRERDGFILRSTEIGPVGWNQMIHSLVQAGDF
ncbi:HAD-IIB family hydrolase [Peteryoungia ipomoeae]|uniref:HAD-IIB family hydrolase n=1 Tax=Peteryoungia ipomoeae TaxID=1210932 RepID=A0A4S8P7E5_9HYPH|nr:HAD-IIB family hydrolase [Peteryoungia ipomoeae]THV25501.1 HAD-IIB family hydrolase [Peteryoungia ipomoeae]